MKRLSAQSRDLLNRAESVELFSLGGVDDLATEFPGATVLGRVKVEDRTEQRNIIDRILLANRWNAGGFLCLGAEYGVRIQTEGEEYDLTFCFDCGQVWVRGPSGYYDNGEIALHPAALFNRLLKRGKVPLPPRTHE